jgi:hypothetical protein
MKTSGSERIPRYEPCRFLTKVPKIYGGKKTPSLTNAAGKKWISACRKLK